MGTETVGGQVLDPQGALATSLGGFNTLGQWGVGIGIGFIVISFLIKGWAHANHEGDNHPGPSLTDRGQEDRSVTTP